MISLYHIYFMSVVHSSIATSLQWANVWEVRLFERRDAVMNNLMFLNFVRANQEGGIQWQIRCSEAHANRMDRLQSAGQ